MFYYTFNNFWISGKTLSFVGYLQCTEEDDCNYETNSIFLVSNEDKVIEVEDNTSTWIISGIGLAVLVFIILLIIRRKKKN